MQTDNSSQGHLEWLRHNNNNDEIIASDFNQ